MKIKIKIALKVKKSNITPNNEINNKIENKSSISSHINSFKNKEELNEAKNKEQNIKDIQTYLLNKEKNEINNKEEMPSFEYMKDKINVNINNVQISQTKLNNDSNKKQENAEEIKTEQDSNTLLSDFNIQKQLEIYDFLKNSPARNNVFNNINLRLNDRGMELYDKYDFLDTPGLSDYTKAFLSSQASALRPELNIYTRAYLNSLGNDDDNNKKRPELTKLTKEYLSKNDLLNDIKEEKSLDNK